MSLQKVLVIIPAFNEEENIDDVIKSVENVSKRYKYHVDYLVIDDCSRDGTLDVLRCGGRNYISLPVNLGIGGGMQCGYIYALEYGYDAAVQIDADGQHDPEYLDSVVSPVLKGQADMVVGSRFLTKEGFQSSSVRRIGIRFLSRLIRLVCEGRVDVKDVTSGFRAAGREVICFFAHEYAQDYPEPESIVACAKNNFRVCEVPVVMHERIGGKSSISPVKSVYYMVKVSIAVLFQGAYGGTAK